MKIVPTIKLAFRITTKQQQIIETVRAKNPDGTLIDLDQLIERLPYETTKASIQFSLRALIERELLAKVGLERRRGYNRRLYDLGKAALEMYATDRADAVYAAEMVGVQLDSGDTEDLFLGLEE